MGSGESTEYKAPSSSFDIDTLSQNYTFLQKLDFPIEATIYQ